MVGKLRASGYVTGSEAAAMLGQAYGSRVTTLLAGAISDRVLIPFANAQKKRGTFMWNKAAVEKLAAKRKAVAAQPTLPVAKGNGRASGEEVSTTTSLGQALLVSARVRDVETRVATLTAEVASLAARVEKLTAALGGW